MIRSATKQHWPQIEAIYNACKLDELVDELKDFKLIPISEDSERRKKLNSATILVCERESKGKCVVLGFIAFTKSHIDYLYVLRAERSAGIGRRLLRSALSQHKADARLSINVAKSNRRAIRMYREFGFQPESEFIAHYNGEAVVALKMFK